MRVFIYISLFFLCCKNGTLCHAQDAVLDTNKLPKTIMYFEDYVDRSNEMEDFTSDIGKGYMKNGQYYYENKHEYGRDDFSAFNLDPTKDYYIEMIFSFIDGRVDRGNGIAFNHSTTKLYNGYYFVISADQYFKVYKFVDDIEKEIEEWKPCSYVKSTGKNKLALLAKGTVLYFYVNDMLVYQMKRPEHIGSNIGCTSSAATVVAVDRFLIRYDPLPFDAITSAHKEYKRIKLDSNINSNTDDNYPVVSADGKMMFFARTQKMGITELEDRTIMSSEYNDSTQRWSPAKALSSAINQGGMSDAVYISPDKNILILNATYENGVYIESGGLSISYRTNQGWSRPEPMFINDYENKGWYEGYSFSSDNKTMILSIQKSKGYGERDLYVSFRIPGTTNWTTPQNLGAVVNSFGVESAPCLAPDNKTLYYCSGGKPGYGKRDIFVTRRLDDTWLNWSRPLNLGPEINSRLDDATLTVYGNGAYAFVDKYSPATKNDIARVALPEPARAKAFIIVRGKVYNKLTNKPIEAVVLFENSNGEGGSSMIRGKKGTYELTLVYGTNYKLNAEVKGYVTEIKNIDLTDTTVSVYKEILMDIYVTPLSVGASLPLNTIVFETGKVTFLKASYLELEYLYTVMIDNPAMEIEIQGYADNTDTASGDEVLKEFSLSRANSVKEYLVSKGIVADRIKIIGYSRSKNNSKANKDLNGIKVNVIKL